MIEPNNRYNSDSSLEDSDDSHHDDYEAQHGQNLRECDCSSFNHILMNTFVKVDGGF